MEQCNRKKSTQNHWSWNRNRKRDHKNIEYVTIKQKKRLQKVLDMEQCDSKIESQYWDATLWH